MPPSLKEVTGGEHVFLDPKESPGTEKPMVLRAPP